MSAAATADQAPKSGKGKLFLILGVVLLLAGAAAGYFLVLKKPAADTEHEEVAQHNPKLPPVFVALDSMVVNLADRGGDRFAQVGLSLQVADAKMAEQVKLYLPSIRSATLLLISQKTAEELLQHEGKRKLAAEIMHEAALSMGLDVDEEAAPAKEQDGAVRKKRRKPRGVPNPVQDVVFSNFIVQ